MRDLSKSENVPICTGSWSFALCFTMFMLAMKILELFCLDCVLVRRETRSSDRDNRCHSPEGEATLRRDESVNHGRLLMLALG